MYSVTWVQKYHILLQSFRVYLWLWDPQTCIPHLSSVAVILFAWILCFEDLFSFLCVWLFWPACMSVYYVRAVPLESRRDLELEEQTVVSRVLGTESRPSARVRNAFEHWGISAATAETSLEIEIIGQQSVSLLQLADALQLREEGGRAVF